jgi:chromate reductase, NAD(P)H dehydrogenase (quinone)
MRQMKILAIPGSLRQQSSNHTVIDVAMAYLADKAECTVYDGLGALPPFDDSSGPAAEVARLRRLIGEADGVLIVTPEYAFGVPGILKNLLDWTVSSGELVGKPVAVITAATGGDKAHASLLLTLSALSARVADDAWLLIPFIKARMKEGVVVDEATVADIRGVAGALLRTTRQAMGQ